MSSDSLPTHDPSWHSAAPPPPETRPPRIAEVPSAAPPPLPAGVKASSPEQRGRGAWRAKWAAGLPLLMQLVAWYRRDGFWYITSTVAHAVGLFSLALMSMAIPQTILVSDLDAPSFESAEVDRESAPPVTRFEVGDAPLEPTELSTETLTWTEALPIGGQTAKYYDDSPEFEEAGGGTLSDVTGPKLGGLGGFSIANLPGPGGRGGVGVGEGLGQNAGWGGAGEGFGNRGKGHRDALLGAMGGTRASERAVGAALNWFHRHQTPQGKWSLDHRSQCKGGICTGPGDAESDSAATALSLLPFLAAGQTHKSKGPYRQTVAKGVAWLIKQQRADGDLSGGCPQPMYAHGMATITLCEVYGMTHDEHVGRAARQAVAYIQRAQNQSTGGWRYTPGEAGDTSVFGWQMMALKSAMLAGLPVDSLTLDNARRWLQSVARGEHLGLYSYRPYEPVTPTMTAVGMLCRQYMGIAPNDPSLLEGKEVLMQNLPDITLGRDTYYWYYGTLVMNNFADAEWDAWNRKMRRTLIESQVKEGCATGSWDPEQPTIDKWGARGGRVMTTSFSTLCLEVYYRQMPLFMTDATAPKPGAMGFPGGAADETKKP